MTDQRLLTLAIVLALGWLILQLSPILTPFLAAALLAYLGDPLVDRLEKLKLKRTPAVMITFVLIFVFLGLVFLLLVPMVRDQGSALASKLPGYVRWVENHWLPTLADWVGWEGQREELGLAAVLSEYSDKIAGLLTGALSTVGRSGGVLLTTLVYILLIPILSFYLLRDFDLIVARLAHLVPPKRRERVFKIARESDDALSNFLKGQTVVMLGLAIIWSVGLSLIGLEHALAIGVLSGILSFVPYLGPATGLILGALSALVPEAGWMPVLGVGVVFLVSQMIENYYLTPKFVGDRIGLHPVMVIFAVMAGGQLGGFFGVLLALPVAAVATVFMRHVYEWYGVGVGLEGMGEQSEDPEVITASTASDEHEQASEAQQINAENSSTSELVDDGAHEDADKDVNV